MALPAAPASVGVRELVNAPADGVVSDTAGGVVSTVKVFAVLRPTLPASSLCSACAVYTPSASAVVAGADQEAPDAVADRTCTGVPDAAVPA